MDTKKVWVAAGAALLAVGLIALPGPSRSFQDPPAAAPKPEVLVEQDQDDEQGLNLVTPFADDSESWLGVETREVTADKVKELRLPAERGVIVGKVLGDSPAAKSGLKDGDVITEINNQRVEAPRSSAA